MSKWLVSETDENQFWREGWGLFLSDTGQLRIQKIDARDVFGNDAEAIRFVADMAAKGSALHCEALTLHNTTPPEFQRKPAADALAAILSPDTAEARKRQLALRLARFLLVFRHAE